MKIYNISIFSFLLSANFSIAQDELLKPIIDESCDCFTTVEAREGQAGYNYLREFDNCLYSLQKELVKLDSARYRDIYAVLDFASTTIDKNCTMYYKSELVRGVLGNFTFIKTGAKPDVVPPSNTWYHFEGITDSGKELEVQIRFISLDTFEYVSQLKTNGVVEQESFMNDIAFYDSGATKFFTPTLQVFLNKDYSVNEPLNSDDFVGYTASRRFDYIYRAFEQNYRNRTDSRTEAAFYFLDSMDIKKGFYLELVSEFWNSVDKEYEYIHNIEVINAPLTFVKTTPFSLESSPYFQREAIVDSMCSCAALAIETERVEKFDFKDNIEKCRNELTQRLFAFDTSYNDAQDVRRFELDRVKKKCSCYDEVDSILNYYQSFNIPFKSVAKPDDCLIMHSGTFTILDDKDSALIFIDEKNYIVEYRDGSKTKYTIQWIDEQTFELTFIKTNNDTLPYVQKGTKRIYTILRVKDEQYIYFEWKDAHSSWRTRGTFVKISN